MIDAVWSADELAISSVLASYSMGSFSNMQGDIVVWRDNGEVLGCAACASHASRRDAWLNCVAVKKGHRRQGIGKKLVCHFVNAFYPKHDLWLETMFWNRRFYASLGFSWIPIKDMPQYFIFDPRSRTNTMLMAMLEQN